MHSISTFLHHRLFFLTFALFAAAFAPNELYAQCSATTPVYEVNLVGKPNGSWTSPEVNRDGTCCSAPSNETCVQFNITLDALSGGLQFEITSGPIPPGAMTYQIDCGPPMAVGDPICVTGAGPHELTICMPGNSNNTFTVYSIAAYEPAPDANVTGGCSATLQAPLAFDPATVEWNDITGNGTYNSYLSCTSGCSTPTVTPDANPPAFVDYTVCGNSTSAVCTDIPYCDTVRVHFYPTITASISPDPAIICPGNGSVELTGNATGGSGYYDYFWFDAAGTLLANAQTYQATAVGTYTLEVRNENYPNCPAFTASRTVTQDLSVSAGPDQQECANEAVQLAGTVTGASGGIWSGGAGSYFPSDTDLNAQYFPTETELAAGSLTLTLTTTGNGSCDPLSDQVLISFHSFDVSITAPATLCAGSTATLTANVAGGTSPYSYAWTSGETTQSISNKAAGTYTVAVTDSENCSFYASATITEVAGPTDLSASTTASSCSAANGSISITRVTGGTAAYTYSIDGTNFQASETFTGLLAGTYTITVKDANGCTYAEGITLTDQPGPTDMSLNPTASSCGDANGQISVSNVTGGTTAYTYSIDGTNFQASETFTGLLAGTYTITVKDANGCTYAEGITLTDQAGPTAVSASSLPASCADNDGSIEAGAVTGGTSPYTYSIDGTNFQTSTTFTGLASGSYTLTAKDANGCTISTVVSVIKTEPTDLLATLSPSSCSEANGEIVVSSVTGGITPYTYSLDGTNFQTSATFSNLIAGNYTITVKDANGCTYAEGVSLTDQPGPTDLNLSPTSSTCSAANGEIVVSAVTGGTASYTYSIDGTNFQTSTTFSGLLAGTYTVTVKDANGCTYEEGITLSDIPGPTDLSASSTSSSCGNANGSISISAVTGGTAAYTYSIDGTNFQASETFTGLLAGTYTIIVKDANGCTYNEEINVSDIPGPTDLTASTTPSSCSAANGEISITGVTGGTAAYTYSIDGTNFQASETFTGLLAGTYTITVKDANGCTYAEGITLTDQAGPTAVSASSLPASCADNDGSIEAGAVTGGTSPYTYSIDGTNFQTSTTFTGLASGSYTLTAKDANGCIITTAVSVIMVEPVGMEISSTSSTCSLANGQLTVSAVSGGIAPYTYSIDGTNFQTSTTFSGLLAGTYTVTVKDANGCTYAEGVTLSDIPGPTDLSASSTSSTCSDANGSISISAVTGGTAAYTYSIDGTNFQASETFTDLLAGTYTIIVKDANGCTYSEEINVSDIPGPADISLSLSPSTCSEANGAISIASVTGGTAAYTYSIDGTNFQTSETFSGLMAGIYTITVKDANGCTYSENVILSDIPGPTDFSASSTSSTCGDANGIITVTGISGGTSPYAYSADGINFQASSSLSGLVAGAYMVVIKDANGCIISKEVSVSDIAGPTAVTASSLPASCAGNDGSITVESVIGGTAAYTYSIDGTNFQASEIFTNLAFGSYTVTARDANGCTISSSIVVDRVGPTDMTIATEPSTCGTNTGSLTISSVSGGPSPYAYSIDGTNFQASETFSSLSSGLYTVWVKDANGCSYSEEVSINDIGGATDVSTSLRATSCGNSNGEISITAVTGGTSPYTYSLDGTNFQAGTTFSGLAADTYLLQVKDASGCLYSEEVVLEDMPAPSDMLISTASSTCGSANGALSINEVTAGTAPYTYSVDGTNFQASASFSEMLAGTYTVTVKDANGCTYSEEATISNIAGPTSMSLSTTTSICSEANGSLQVESVTGGTAPYTYSIDGTNYQASASFQELLAGTYEVSVKDFYGCIITQTISISDIPGPSGISATAQDATCADNNGSIEVVSVTGGTAPYSYSVDGINFQASTIFSGLASGTYTVVARDANGCTISTDATVLRIEPTDLTASTQPTSCGSSNGEISISGTSGGISPYTYSIDGIAFQSSTNFSGLAAGTYTITVKDANGCTYAEEVLLEDQPAPTDVLYEAVFTTCGNANGKINISSITAGTAPYSYSLDGVDFQTSESFSGLAAGTYTLTVKDANGCLYAEEVVLENIAGPTDFNAVLTASTCGNVNGIIDITGVTGGTAAYTYSLDGTNFQADAAFSGLPAGTHEVTIKDANGCTYSKEVILENIPGPTDLSASSTSSTCGDANASLQISSVSGGTAPYTYSLDGENYQSEDSFTGLLAGEHLLRVKDANGCVYEESILIENIAGPGGLEASTTLASCEQENGNISISAVSGGTAPYSYSIDGTTFQSDETFSQLAAGTYSLSVKDANGCLYTKEVNVESATGATAISTTVTPSSCTAEDGSITIESVNGGTAPYSYSLDGNTYQSNNSFEGLAAATYTLSVKDANGCVASFTETVSSQGPQSANTSTTDASCGEADGVISIESVNGGTAPYTYSIDGINFQSTASFTELVAGNYLLSIRDANDCALQLSLSIGNIGGPEDFTQTLIQPSCGESNGSIAISEVVGGSSPYTYSIDGSTYQEAASFTALAAGIYTLSVKDASGCVLYRSDTLHNEGAPTAISYSSLPASCETANGSLQITAVSGGLAPYTYSLGGTVYQEETTFEGLPAGNHTLYVKDAKACTYSEIVFIEGITGPAEVQFSTKEANCEKGGELLVEAVTGGTAPYSYALDDSPYQSNTDFTGLSAGSYTLHVKDANECILSRTLQITEAGVSLDYLQAVSCYGSADGKIAFRTSGGDNKPQFSIDGGSSYQADSVFSNLPAGSYTVQVKFSANCTLEMGPLLIAQPDSLWAVVNQTAKAIGTEPTGSAVLSKVAGGTAPYRYALNEGAFTTDTIFNQLSGGEHSLRVQDAAGCEIMISFHIELISDLEIPNSFTPNGDGINDYWALKNLSLLYPNCKLAVYNRWGSAVYKSDGYAQEWDGTHNGKVLPDATYYYIIQLNETEAPLKGSVTIMR